MATKGLRLPVFGRYNYDGNVVTYTNGFIAGKAVEYSSEIELTDDNPLYGDDQIAEHDYGKFNGGTLTLNTTDLDQRTSKFLLNLKEIQTQIGQSTVTELVYDDDAPSTPFGFGIVEVKQINDVDKYRAVLLCRVTPSIPSEAATTMGESIEWQTKELECTLEKSEQASGGLNHPWKREAWFDTYDAAMEYLKTMLNVLEEVELSAAAGTASGQTKITIGNPISGASYKYSTDGPAPTYKQKLTSWTDFTSGEDITAANGTTVYVAQVDGQSQAIGVGTVTAVTSGG